MKKIIPIFLILLNTSCEIFTPNYNELICVPAGSNMSYDIYDIENLLNQKSYKAEECCQGMTFSCCYGGFYLCVNGESGQGCGCPLR